MIRHFSAWTSWFPILFYTTLYVSDLYKRSLPPSAFEGNIEDIEAEGTRLGSRAQLLSALLALTTNFLAPLIVRNAASSDLSSDHHPNSPRCEVLGPSTLISEENRMPAGVQRSAPLSILAVNYLTLLLS